MAAADQAQCALDPREDLRAWQFHSVYRVLTALALPEAACLYLRLCVRSPRGIRWLKSHGHRPWRTVYGIATGRLVRRVQRRTRGALSPVVVWPETLPSICVLAFFHSPWDLVMARESAHRQYCLVRASPLWAESLGQQRVNWDRPGLRSLVRRVRSGRRCAAAMDNFVGRADAGFCGTQSPLNPAAARLAAVTGAPLVPIWPCYDHGVLSFEVGAPIAAAACTDRRDEALRLAGDFFQNAVLQDPASWRRILWFLEVAL